MAEGRDCGPAVFASVARYFGHHLSLEEARGLVGTDRNGTTLAGLRDGGCAIGLSSRPAHATFEALGHIPLPAIAHLNGQEGHYVVVYCWSPSGVVVLDPNRGAVRLGRAKFEALWSGYLVEFRPTAALSPRAPRFRPKHVFWRFTRMHSGALLLGLLCALAATAVGWAGAFFIGTLFDNILPAGAVAVLGALGAVLILAGALQATLQFARAVLAARIGRHMQEDYGMSFIAHLMRLPMQVFDARCVPGLVLRVTQVDLIQQAITDGSIILVSDVALFLAALVIVLQKDLVAGLVALASVPLLLLGMLALNDRVHNAQFAMMVRMEEFGALMVDSFDALRTIKVFSAEDRFQNELQTRLQHLSDARHENRVALALPTAWSVLVTSLVAATVLWYGGSRTLSHELTAGDLVVLFGMVTFCLIPVQRFPANLVGIHGALIGIERLEEIRALPAESERISQAVALPVVRGEIRFDHVSFAYNRHRPVLSDINLNVSAGETVAIVGETGSGKTSLANLIAGFYLPTEGDVLIDGFSTRTLDPESLRQSISAVFQDAKLLQQSVRNNITLLGDAPLEAVRGAACLANADAFISRLLHGYDAQVARGGDNFSSGQAQRIAIARALLKNAPILILDEATSNLDGATEQGVLQALRSNRRGRTTIVIAHRHSTVMLADRVFVIDDGRLVETGTPDELMRLEGRYFELFKGQACTHPASVI
jgi:ATP-binding cassette subfamily B protein